MSAQMVMSFKQSKIAYLVIRSVTVYMMHMISFGDFAVVVFPYRSM